MKIFAGTVYPNYSEYGCYYVVAANTAEDAKETVINHIRDSSQNSYRTEPLTTEGALMLIGGIPDDSWYLMEVGYTEDYKEPRVISQFLT